jgi:asparagine synthase (glutamine-hydrolysing)
MRDRLPDKVTRRTKAKFWEGAGVGELLSQYASRHIADDEFKRERTLRNGWLLTTKEELMYYRIFKEHFGEFTDLSWMGRTKGVPRVNQT